MAIRISRTASAFMTTRSTRSSLWTRIQALSQFATFVSPSKFTQTQSKFHQIPVRRNFHTTLSYSSTSQSKASKYSYRIAASFMPKDGSYTTTKNTYNFNPFKRIQTHLDARDISKRPDSGQDAFFVSPIKDSNDVALGVCDGVGGWADSGVDPADFSHGICGYMAEAAQEPLSRSIKHKEWTAQKLMQRGYDDICEDPKVRAGGSTACVAIAKSTGDLEVANLGDSGFMVLRLNAIHAISPPQTHSFNTPYQLSIIPEEARAREAAFGGHQLQDMPQDANVTKHQLRHGDVVVFATDGVWDNMFQTSILRAISQYMVHTKAWEHTSDGIRVGEHLDAFTKGQSESTDGTASKSSITSLQHSLAVSVAVEAKAASMNTKLNGPFAREVQKYYPDEGWRGGKVDDICVVVMIAVEEGK